MKCLTRTEAQEWLAPSGLVIAEDLSIDLDELSRKNKYTARRRLLRGELNLWRISEATIGWLPKRGQRMLWLSSWDTYPAGQVNFVEKIRRGCGEMRSLLQAPGHLFEPATYVDYDDRSSRDVDEEAVMAGLVLSVLSLHWDAVLFSKECEDYVFISDGFALFSSNDAERIAFAPAGES
jgi:hypothetical protein